MTQKQLSISLLAFLLSATASLSTAAAANPPSQSVSTKTISNISCVASTIEKNADGSLKKCVLAENKTIPGADITCSANNSIILNEEGNLSQCMLAFDRAYPEPTGVICDDGKIIAVHPNGTLAKCTAVSQKKMPALGVACAVGKELELYPDGDVKQCVNTVEKKVPAAPTKEVHVTEFTCTANSSIAFHENDKVQQCTPTEPIYMRGKGTCMAGESVTLQNDGKVQECTYTYPLYQNKSCKVESRVSFHTNGSYKDCTLPEDKTVGKAICKADAAVSYRANGTIESCTLAAPAEQVPGKVLPAGTVVSIDEKNALTEKTAAPVAKPIAPAAPAAPAAPDKK